MGKVTIVKGDLFSAPEDSILIHACNCKGVWGSGIAKTFAQKFPKARDVYAQECYRRGSALLGTCLLIPATNYTIGCLFTSKSYGQYVDSPDKILLNTKKAIADLIKKNVNNKPLSSCKINSGLFKVPWEDTEALMVASGANFTIYEF